MVARGRVLANASVDELLGGSEAPVPEPIPRRTTLEDVYLRLTGGDAEFTSGSCGEVER